PEQGEQIYLSDKANISLGGDPVDVLDNLTEDIKQTAVQAMQSISGLTHGAVDMLISKDSSGEKKGYVIELNPTSQLGGILFPISGKARDIPAAVMDYYFPETKNFTNEIKTFYSESLKELEQLVLSRGKSQQVTQCQQVKR